MCDVRLQVMAALAAREAGIPHIEALLHQAILQVGGCVCAWCVCV